MNATKEEILGIVKIAQEATKEAILNATIQGLKMAAPLYKGQDGEFALNNFANTFAAQITKTSVQEG